MTKTDKVAAVTGASKGLGRHLARRLVKEGWKVALLARPSTELDQAATEFGERSVAIPCDLADPESVIGSFKSIEAQFGRLDLLINNAAVALLNQIEDISDNDIYSEIATNLTGPICATRSAIPLMRQSGGGTIVNASSLAATMPMPYMTMYTTTKAALEAFSNAVKPELAASDIRLIVVRLGAIRERPGLTRSWDDAKKKAYLEAVKQSGKMSEVGKWAEPEDVAANIVRLATDRTSSHPDFVQLTGA